MVLFNFGKKKKEEKKYDCTCNCGCQELGVAEVVNDYCGELKNSISCIKVLGSGCKSCHEMYENVKKAVKEMNLPVDTEYITDLQKVTEYGVMSMPALVINDTVVSSGKVLNPKDIEKLLHMEV